MTEGRQSDTEGSVNCTESTICPVNCRESFKNWGKGWRTLIMMPIPGRAHLIFPAILLSSTTLLLLLTTLQLSKQGLDLLVMLSVWTKNPTATGELGVIIATFHRLVRADKWFDKGSSAPKWQGQSSHRVPRAPNPALFPAHRMGFSHPTSMCFAPFPGHTWWGQVTLCSPRDPISCADLLVLKAGGRQSVGNCLVAVEWQGQG